jgi:hypothetical protein
METCSSCRETLTDRGYHCPSCGVQVKCKSCGELLNANARFCVQCGMAIGQSVLPTSDQNGQESNGTFNIIEVDRDSRSSRFRARVTDHAIDSLSDPLTIYLAGQTGLSVKRREPLNTQPSVYDQPLLVGLTPGDSSDNGALSEKAVQDNLLHSKPADLEAQRLKELFREREGKLRLDEPQLRATGKLDYAQRLTYLFLYANEKVGNEAVLRSVLNTLLEDNNVYDPHASNWIKHEAALVKEGEDIFLNSEGRRTARKFLDEVFDSNRMEAWLPGESAQVRGGSRNGEAVDKTARAAKTPGQAKRRSRSEVTKVLTPRWKALGILPNSYALLKSRSSAQQGIFGLWAIRKVSEDAKVISAKILSNFLYHAFEIKANARTLENALKEEAKKSEKLVIHISGTKFQITPDGMAAAEKIANLKALSAKK